MSAMDYFKSEANLKWGHIWGLIGGVARLSESGVGTSRTLRVRKPERSSAKRYVKSVPT